jgi:hypothetical protein
MFLLNENKGVFGCLAGEGAAVVNTDDSVYE